MKPTLCSRCKKNLAVIFITKIDGGKTVNEGLCLKCAKEMGIKPVDDMIERMGLSEDDLENLNGEMTEAMNGLEGLLGQNQSDDDEADENDSQTATFPFLNKLFGAAQNANPAPQGGEGQQRPGREEKKGAASVRRKSRTAPKTKSTNSSIPTARTSRRRRATASWTISSAARRSSSASSRSSTAARRTIPASSASRASARRPSPRAWPRRSRQRMSPISCRTKRST